MKGRKSVLGQEKCYWIGW